MTKAAATLLFFPPRGNFLLSGPLCGSLPNPHPHFLLAACGFCLADFDLFTGQHRMPLCRAFASPSPLPLRLRRQIPPNEGQSASAHCTKELQLWTEHMSNPSTRIFSFM